MFNDNQDKELLALKCKGLGVTLSENELSFQRKIELQEITLRNAF